MGGGDDEGAGQDGGSMSLSFSGEGVMDFDEEVGRMEMELPAMGTATQTIFHEGTVYTQIPTGAGGEEQWIRHEGGRAATPGMDGDPIGMVEVVEAAEGDIEELGDDEIRGVAVDGFAFTVAGSELAQGDDEVPQGMGDLDVPMEVWLDGDDRVRRLVMELDTGAVMQSGTDESADGQQDGPGTVGDMATLTVTMEFFDFGTDVDVELPADEDVISADEFQRQMQDVPGLGSEG